MLKKPYKKFYQLDQNSYYTLQTGDTQFLVTETYLPYKRIFRFGEFTTAIKMLPLNSPILMLLIEFIKLKKVGESEEKEGLEVEEYFEILDVKAVRNKLKEIVDDLETGNHRFDYRKPAHNETVKQLILEGYTLLTTEVIGTYMRKQWLTRSDKNGVIRIVEVSLGGKPASSKVVDVKFHVYNKNIVDNLLVSLQ